MHKFKLTLTDTEFDKVRRICDTLEKSELNKDGSRTITYENVIKSIFLEGLISFTKEYNI